MMGHAGILPDAKRYSDEVETILLEARRLSRSIRMGEHGRRVVDQKYFPVSENKISKLNVVFSASFGRQLEYYTGMVFKIDINSKSKNRNIINGGRYDKLISDLGAKNQVAALGAALNLNY